MVIPLVSLSELFTVTIEQQREKNKEDGYTVVAKRWYYSRVNTIFARSVNS